MTYMEQCLSMAAHLSANKTDVATNELIDALCKTLVATLASSIEDHHKMHSAIAGVYELMQEHACELHKQMHPEQNDHNVIDAEDFLRDHFNPGVFHG